jgi:hypothetical protein
MMAWIRFGRKRQSVYISYYPGICLERLRKPQKPSVRIAGLRTET